MKRGVTAGNAAAGSAQTDAEPNVPGHDLFYGERGAEAAGGGERILVVEDDAGVLDYVASVLRMSGYEVFEAPDAQKALATLRTEIGIGLLISDINLPGGVDGIELSLAARRALPELRTLFISGHARDALAAHGMEETDIELLAKPFRPDDLLMRIGQILEARETAAVT